LAPNIVVSAVSVASRSRVTHAIWTGVWACIASRISPAAPDG
jgi:hypothetical protein